MKTYRVILDITIKDDETHPRKWAEDAIREFLEPTESVKLVTVVEPETQLYNNRTDK